MAFDRSAAAAWYRRNRARSREIFDLLAEQAYYSRPIALRHPIVFYEGHLPGFSFNTLVKKGLGRPSIDAQLETLFARGIDPHETAVGAGGVGGAGRAGKAGGAGRDDGWPERDEVRAFADEADRQVIEAILNADVDQPGHPLLDRAEGVFTILEHEVMHQETLLYMWHRLPFEQKRRPAGYQPRVEGVPPRREWMQVPAGCATLGVPRGTQRFGWDNEHPALSTNVPAFAIERHDVTNEHYLEFVDAGGYGKREYWKQPFQKGGRVLSWEEALAQFRDATGRPGPAGWQQGDYPAGREDYPVSGVSWYEAAAYAEFAGKSLPTIWHWNQAANIFASASVVPASNFGGQGPAPGGKFPGLGPWGTYDMAGNVKEWCWNDDKAEKRYILGGGWDEPVYLFTDADARSPFGREPNFGFRCVKYISSGGAGAAADPVVSPARNYSQEKPCTDDLFRIYKSFFAYDKKPLNAKVEGVEESSAYRRERVTFDAAYGNERVIAFFYLPLKFKPPLQALVFYPGSGVIQARTINPFLSQMIEFLVKSGRAVIFPMFKGTLERGDDLASDYPDTTASYRDHVIAWSKDMGRSIDFLETRPEIDRTKLAFYGFSWGAAMGPIMTAVEDRIKVNVFVVPGFYLQRSLPEVDQINFAPRVKIPTLMLNGRYDFFCPVETSQLPMFRLLGTPKEQKRHVIYETGHNIPQNELIKESLNWLDRYLGPVQ
jgi:formylglycine-generating enzyme required for sulfatase activity/cephalosporin-C deacetylase-like acetyl esterase